MSLVKISNDPFVLDTEEVAIADVIDLLVSAGASVTVTHIKSESEAETKPAPKVEEVDEEEDEEEVVVEVVEVKAVKKPAEKITPQVTKNETKAETKAEAKPTYTYDSLVDSFTQVIDKDYDAALDLLQEFGAQTLNDIDKTQYTKFGVRVDELLAAD
jgi:predicted RND superfamily exporter protein